MLRITLKGVRGHILRFLLTVAAVTLGVSLLAGTYVFTDSINVTFDEIVDQGSKGVDVQVRGEEAGTLNQQGETARVQLPLALADRLQALDGVAAVRPDFQGFAVLVGENGTAVRNGGAPTLSFALFPDDPALTVVKGRAPSGPGEVAVESSTLKLSGLDVGDRTQALIGNNPRDVTISAEVKFDAGLAGATVVALDPATAQQEFAPDGQIASFSVQAREGVDAGELRDRISGVLPAQAEAITGADVVEENKEAIRDQLGFINIFLRVFAFISLFVGLFIIYNTFSMLVAQRTRELALLRAVGASRGQVVRTVLGEAVVLGLAGSLLGIGVGVGMAAGLQALFGLFGLQISGGLPVLPRTVVYSFVAGVAVTLVSALLPALRAARIAPVAAMRDDVIVTARGLRNRGIVGGVLLAAGIALVATALGDEVTWALFGLGSFLTVIGLLVAAPLAIRPVVRLVAAPLVLVTGTVGRLARENSLRVPRRTSITASALMIGLALMAALSVVAQSTKASVSDLVERQLTADFVLNGGFAPISPGVARTVAELPGVASVATIGAIPVQVSETDTRIAVAADPEGIQQNVKLSVTSGAVTALSDGQVLISESTADDKGWKLGSTVTATIGTQKDQRLTVGGVYEDNQVLNNPALLLPRAVYEKSVPAAQQGDFLVYVKAASGSDSEALRQQLVDVVKPFIVVSVQDGDEFTASQADQVNQLLLILYALLFLSVIIAVLGIINTLALSVFERTREIGLLRAVGLSRGQLSRIITIEAVMTALFGAILGAALGLGLGVALQRGLADQGLEVLDIPWLQIVLVLVGAAIAGVVAAVLPAIRAVRLDVLKAIATE